MSPFSDSENKENNWRWATAADLTALEVLNFTAEVTAAKTYTFRISSLTNGSWLTLKRDGKIVGGLFAEDAVVVIFAGYPSNLSTGSTVDSGLTFLLNR
jgi:hypothetical protein